MKPIAQDELSLSDQLKLDLKEAQKEERLASAKTKEVITQITLEYYDSRIDYIRQQVADTRKEVVVDLGECNRLESELTGVLNECAEYIAYTLTRDNTE